MSGSGKLAVQVKGVRLDRTHLHLADVEAFWPAMKHAINFVRPLTQTAPVLFLHDNQTTHELLFA